MKKVETSKYIQSIRPQLKELLACLLKEYEYVSIFAEDSYMKEYEIFNNSRSVIENPDYTTRGVVIKVYDGKAYSEYAFNNVNQEEIDLAVDTLKHTLSQAYDYLHVDTDLHRMKKIDDTPCVFHKSTEYEIHPKEIGAEKILDELTQISAPMIKMHKYVCDYGARFQYQQSSKLFLSENRDMMQDVMWSEGIVYATGYKKGGKITENAKRIAILGGAEVLPQLKAEISQVVDSVVGVLDSETIIPGEYDCICDPSVTGVIIHETFGHGTEMDGFVQKGALAEAYIGKQVASELITMHDSSTGHGITRYFFDDEGVLAQDTVIIEKGILKRGISDVHSALYLGTEPTGNGRRASFSEKAYSRMSNTFLESGTDQYEDMIASISYGFLLEDAQNGVADPKNWGMQCVVKIAREIKDGKFTGKTYSPVLISGYVLDILKSVSMVSKNGVWNNGSFCQKSGQYIRVCTGGPYIKTKMQLS